MTKTKEEIYEYVFNYKAKLLNDTNNDMQRLYDRANDTSLKLNSDTIIISAGLITLIGAIISTKNIALGVTDKILITAAIGFLFLSIVGGLFAYLNAVKFWYTWAAYRHDLGGKIRRNNSKTVEELEPFLEEIMESEKRLPQKANTFTEKVQLFSFGLAFLALAIEVINIVI